MAAVDWGFLWDNTSAHTTPVVTDWMAAKQIQAIHHNPYSPDLAPANFFKFPRVKKELASLTFTQETFKKECEGDARTIFPADLPYPLGSGMSAECVDSPMATLKGAKNKLTSNHNCFFFY
jgi:hypothetical protein